MEVEDSESSQSSYDFHSFTFVNSPEESKIVETVKGSVIVLGLFLHGGPVTEEYVSIGINPRLRLEPSINASGKITPVNLFKSTFAARGSLCHYNEEDEKNLQKLLVEILDSKIDQDYLKTITDDPELRHEGNNILYL